MVEPTTAKSENVQPPKEEQASDGALWDVDGSEPVEEREEQGAPT